MAPLVPQRASDRSAGMTGQNQLKRQSLPAYGSLVQKSRMQCCGGRSGCNRPRRAPRSLRSGEKLGAVLRFAVRTIYGPSILPSWCFQRGPDKSSV